MSAEGISFLRQAAVADKDTWFSIHHRVTYADGRLPIFPGNAHQKIRSAIEDASYWAQRGNDVYLAQGMFRNPGVHRVGMPYPSALRQEPNLVACKNLYMDLDVKEGAYKSTDEALAAFRDFLIACHLPMATIIVGSGSGGLHVYWTLNVEFEPREFRRMASQLVAAGTQHGLMFDKQCTSDAIRLLRIPGTWNFKGGQEAIAKPVTLMYNSKKDVDIDLMRNALTKFKSTPTLRVVGGNSQSKPSVNDDLIGDRRNTRHRTLTRWPLIVRLFVILWRVAALIWLVSLSGTWLLLSLATRMIRARRCIGFVRKTSTTTLTRPRRNWGLHNDNAISARRSGLLSVPKYHSKEASAPIVLIWLWTPLHYPFQIDGVQIAHLTSPPSQTKQVT